MSDWSVWIPIFTGLLAFVGAVAGHFVAFDLNAAAKRRDVRRAQIERYAEFISEDQTYMDHYKQETLFGTINFEKETAPRDKAYAIFMLYFATELSRTMNQFITARLEYQFALNNGYVARLQVAAANNQPLEHDRVPQATIDVIQAKYPHYYKAIVDNLDAASKIAQETIPEKSQIGHWCAYCWSRISAPFLRGKKAGGASAQKMS
jgi:hypothetical protein